MFNQRGSRCLIHTDKNMFTYAFIEPHVTDKTSLKDIVAYSLVSKAYAQGGTPCQQALDILAASEDKQFKAYAHTEQKVIDNAALESADEAVKTIWLRFCQQLTKQK
jgi:selenophosphate synthase